LLETGLFFYALEHQDPKNSGRDPRKTLTEKTGVTLPARAKISDFEYLTGMDDMMQMKFDLPKVDALALMRQKPVEKAWKAATYSADGGHWDEPPQLPYRVAEVELPNARYLTVISKPLKSGFYRFWLMWHET
jgi:hypothetical protein